MRRLRAALKAPSGAPLSTTLGHQPAECERMVSSKPWSSGVRDVVFEKNTGNGPGRAHVAGPLAHGRTFQIAAPAGFGEHTLDRESLHRPVRLSGSDAAHCSADDPGLQPGTV